MLFKNTTKILEYAELSTIRYTSLMPTIRLVEQQHIIPQLGATLYNLLNDAYTAAADEATLTDPQRKLLDKCRCVIGPYLCYYYAPKAEVKLSDAGAQRLETATNKTAYQNQVVNFREQNLREAELATELLLQFLDENPLIYTEWLATPGFEKYKGLFIKSGSEFNDFFVSHSPYRNYMAMRTNMLDVEQNNIRPMLGDLLFNHLKATDRDGIALFSPVETDLLFKVKKVIAYLTIATSIPFLNVRLDANGITVMNKNAAQNDDIAKRESADKVMLNNIIEKCQSAASSWINNVTTFMQINAVVLQAYLPDPLVNETQTTPTIQDSQPTLGGSFGII